MRYGVIGGDVRFAHLVSMLNESGRQAKGFLQGDPEENLGELQDCDAVISNWPMRWPLSDVRVSAADVMENIAPGSTLLLCGPKFPEEMREDLRYVNLWQDERLLRENAWLTAEAAVAAAVRRSGRTGVNVRCAVVGMGRIGQGLTEILRNLGAKVTVFSRTPDKRRSAVQSGAKAADLSELPDLLPDMDWIFTTPPACVLDEKALRAVNGNALLMDLASPPYGFDLELARELGVNAHREPGLPGRYCPLSAARAVYAAVIRWEEEENHDEN